VNGKFESGGIGFHFEIWHVKTGVAPKNLHKKAMTENNINERLQVEDSDLQTLKAWVRDDLFSEVKIIYNSEYELRVDGAIYWKFVKCCKDKLIGLRQLQGDRNTPRRQLYLHMLWREANKPKVKLVAEGVSTRRSTVYTAMSNRFSGTS
jgi:hypothetical protein